MSVNRKYFPFAPGVPWKIKNGKYIVPALSMDAWHRALHGKEIVVVAYGGFIESFVSLCFLEIVNYLSPGKKLFWLGNNRFASLVEVNGLAQICESDVSKETFANYPVPLFMDRDYYYFFFFGFVIFLLFLIFKILF